MSRRLSASGRLTRGVAHEVKNPINAIVLHLQLLQNKLQQTDPDTLRHMDIIGNEIQDKIFELSFTSEQGGSGIGLAQTYESLQWHYGSVDFESLDGQGAIFRLRLPVAETRA